MESSSKQEFRDAVLQAGYDLHRKHVLNSFDEPMIEEHLNESGREGFSSEDVSQACEYLLENGLFQRGESDNETAYLGYGITDKGIATVEASR